MINNDISFSYDDKWNWWPRRVFVFTFFFSKNCIEWKKYINQLFKLMYMTHQKGTGFFITAILLTSSFMHFPHQVYSVQIFSLSNTKQGVCIRLKNNFPTVFAFFAPTIFRHERNLPIRFYLNFIIILDYSIFVLETEQTRKNWNLPFITRAMHHSEESLIF